jgi:hypothetical protein
MEFFMSFELIDNLMHRVGNKISGPHASGKYRMAVVSDDGEVTFHYDRANQCDNNGKALAPKSLRQSSFAPAPGGR